MKIEGVCVQQKKIIIFFLVMPMNIFITIMYILELNMNADAKPFFDAIQMNLVKHTIDSYTFTAFSIIISLLYFNSEHLFQ